MCLWVNRVLLYEDTDLVADSGNIINNDHRGGRLGVYCFSQEQVIWSDLVYRCTGRSALRDDANGLLLCSGVEGEECRGKKK